MSTQTKIHGLDAHPWQGVFGKKFTVITPHFTRKFSNDPLSDRYFSDRDDLSLDSL